MIKNIPYNSNKNELDQQNTQECAKDRKYTQYSSIQKQTKLLFMDTQYQ